MLFIFLKSYQNFKIGLLLKGKQKIIFQVEKCSRSDFITHIFIHQEKLMQKGNFLIFKQFQLLKKKGLLYSIIKIILHMKHIFYRKEDEE